MKTFAVKSYYYYQSSLTEVERWQEFETLEEAKKYAAERQDAGWQVVIYAAL